MPVSFADGSKTCKYDSTISTYVVEQLDKTNVTVADLRSNADQLVEELEQTKESLNLIQKAIDDQQTALHDMQNTIKCINAINNEQETKLQAIIKFLNNPVMRFLNYIACWYYITKDDKTDKYRIQPDNRIDRRIRKDIQKSAISH